MRTTSHASMLAGALALASILAGSAGRRVAAQVPRRPARLRRRCPRIRAT